LGRVTAVAVHPEGKLIATATAGGDVRLWPASGGVPTAALAGETAATSLQFSADGSRLAAAYSDGSVRIWDPSTANMLRRLLPHPRGARVVALSPDGLTVAGGGDDGVIQLVDAETETPVRRILPVAEPLPGARGMGTLKVRALAFSPDGLVVVSAHEGSDPFVRVWDVRSGRQIARLREDGDAVRSVVFSPDGGTLATADATGQTIRLWETITWRVRRTLPCAGAPEFPVAFSADGRGLWSTTGGELWRWDLATGRRVRKFIGEHRGDLSCAAAFPFDARVVTGGEDGKAVVWNGADHAAAPPAPADEEIRLEGPWAALAGEDASAAYEAIWAMTAVPQKSVPYLRNRLPQQQPVDSPTVEQLMTELDDERFTVRENATRRLAQLGDSIEPQLRQRLATTSSPEAGQRIEVLLDSLRPALADADTLRDLRVLEILERVGTPDARAALEEVGNGPSGSRLRSRAKAAIQRLDRRATGTPLHSAPPRQ
jgi:WD40 repeat protein